MYAKTDDNPAQTEQRSFDFSRNLTPIDQYAQKQGVSVELVEKCAKLGVVKIRKFKDKSFVIDHNTIKKQDLLENLESQKDENTPPEPDKKETAELFNSPENSTFKPDNANLSHNMHKLNKLMDQANAKSAAASYKKTENTKFKTADQNKNIKLDSEKIKKIREKLQPSFKKGSQKAQTQPKTSFWRIFAARIWQIAALIMFTLFVIAGLSAAWLYLNNQVNLDKLNQAQTTYKSISKDSTSYKDKTMELQSKLMDTKSELGKIQAGYESSQAEIRALKQELEKARTSLKNINQRNSMAVEKLNGQIQKLQSIQD